jgi:hypothetical protein
MPHLSRKRAVSEATRPSTKHNELLFNVWGPNISRALVSVTMRQSSSTKLFTSVNLVSPDRTTTRTFKCSSASTRSQLGNSSPQTTTCTASNCLPNLTDPVTNPRRVGRKVSSSVRRTLEGGKRSEETTAGRRKFQGLILLRSVATEVVKFEISRSNFEHLSFSRLLSEITALDSLSSFLSCSS